MQCDSLKEALKKSFDRLRLRREPAERTNGKLLIPFAVSPSTLLRRALSNALLSSVEGHERNQLVPRFLKVTLINSSLRGAQRRGNPESLLDQCAGLPRAVYALRVLAMTAISN